jgi:dipeptidase
VYSLTVFSLFALRPHLLTTSNRFALEHSSTARLALETIIKLIEEYGQGGSWGPSVKPHDHNGFVIADRNGDCFLLEAVNRDWAWLRITSGAYVCINRSCFLGQLTEVINYVHRSAYFF